MGRVEIGGLVLEGARVTWAGREVALSKHALVCLRALVTARGERVPKEELFLALYGSRNAAGARGRLKSTIHRLRASLEASTTFSVQSLGDGYRLVYRVGAGVVPIAS